MLTLKLFAEAILANLVATPVLAQAAIDEPGYCAQFYPTANCNNEGPGNPYTDVAIMKEDLTKHQAGLRLRAGKS